MEQESSKKTPQYSDYFIVFQGEPADLVHACLFEHLASYGLAPLSVEDAKRHKFSPKFVWMEMIGTLYPPSIYGVHCLLKNLLDAGKRFMCRKTELYFAMPEDVRQTMMAHTVLCTSKSGAFVPPAIGLEGVFIVKPGEATSGIGISVLQNPSVEEIASAVAFAQQQVRASNPKAQEHSPVIMSKYISDIRLWKEKKFHIRAHYLALVSKGVFSTYVCDMATIITAKKPFELAHFDDADIHDTHFSRMPVEEGDFFFPEHADQGGFTSDQVAAVQAQMKAILLEVSKVLQPKAGAYEESAHAFEIFGADFLVREDNTLVLLEVNDKVGYGCLQPAAMQHLSKVYFDWVNEVVLRPVLGGSPLSPTALYSGPASQR